MIFGNLFTFAIVVFAIWINMAIAKAVAGIWLDDEKSTIAAFAFALGSLAGVKNLPWDEGDTFGLWLGVVLAFSSLWWVHFGRPRREAKNV